WDIYYHQNGVAIEGLRRLEAAIFRLKRQYEEQYNVVKSIKIEANEEEEQEEGGDEGNDIDVQFKWLQNTTPKGVVPPKGLDRQGITMEKGADTNIPKGDEQQQQQQLLLQLQQQSQQPLAITKANEIV
ncbi:hypothetical protein RFI_23342, partial [Reticulomyxa filosa]